MRATAPDYLISLFGKSSAVTSNPANGGHLKTGQ
jgi:hypothetical protein